LRGASVPPAIPTEIVTERLVLRTWRDQDAEPLAEIYRQPGYLENMPPADAAEQITAWRERWVQDGFAPWAACERDTGRLVGRIGLLRHYDWPLVADPVEVGWVLHQQFWRRGLATEGGRAAIDIWRRALPDETLYSFTIPRNARSRSVMERLGMTCGGTTIWHGLEHVWYFLRRDGDDRA
jgi:RimJ/RimL family protein N-acetyltransferase